MRNEWLASSLFLSSCDFFLFLCFNWVIYFYWILKKLYCEVDLCILCYAVSLTLYRWKLENQKNRLIGWYGGDRPLLVSQKFWSPLYSLWNIMICEQWQSCGDTLIWIKYSFLFLWLFIYGGLRKSVHLLYGYVFYV